jgi:hypothetical protein
MKTFAASEKASCASLERETFFSSDPGGSFEQTTLLIWAAGRCKSFVAMPILSEI